MQKLSSAELLTPQLGHATSSLDENSILTLGCGPGIDGLHSSRSAGTRTAIRPLKSSALSEDTVQPPMFAVMEATLSIDAWTSATNRPMSTCCQL